MWDTFFVHKSEIPFCIRKDGHKAELVFGLNNDDKQYVDGLCNNRPADGATGNGELLPNDCISENGVFVILNEDTGD